MVSRWLKQAEHTPNFYTFCSGQSTPSLASPKLRLWYWHKNTFRKEPNIREVLWKKKCQREWSSFRNLHDFSRKRRRPLPACIHIYWKLWGLNENFRKTPKQSPLPSFSVTALLKIITVVFFFLITAKCFLFTRATFLKDPLFKRKRKKKETVTLVIRYVGRI